MTAPTEDIWLEQGHSVDEPRLLRLNRPDMHPPDFWAYATESSLPAIAADLLGPDVRFSHSLFNFKWAGIGQAVKWHQDFPFYPHTNDAVLSLSTFLEDIGPEQGPVRVVPGSHRKPIFSHYSESGDWAACLREGDLTDLGIDNAPKLTGPVPAPSRPATPVWFMPRRPTVQTGADPSSSTSIPPRTQHSAAKSPTTDSPPRPAED